MINPIDGRLADLDERLFMPRELSWLSKEDHFLSLNTTL